MYSLELKRIFAIQHLQRLHEMPWHPPHTAEAAVTREGGDDGTEND